MSERATGAHVAAGSGTEPLSGGRATSLGIARVLTGLFVLGVVVNFFLAGLGTFGVKGRIDDDKATTSFDPHRMVGSVLSLLSLLLLVAVAVARPGGRVLKLAGAVFVLMVLQNVLAAVGTDVHVFGALHALNGLLVLGAAGLLAADLGLMRPRR